MFSPAAVQEQERSGKLGEDGEFPAGQGVFDVPGLGPAGRRNGDGGTFFNRTERSRK